MISDCIHHPALDRDEIDEVTARNQRLQLFGAELLQAIGPDICASKPL
jgi:hypothetical protein